MAGVILPGHVLFTAIVAAADIGRDCGPMAAHSSTHGTVSLTAGMQG